MGEVTQTLQNIGVQVMNGDQMRNVGDIMEDLMGVWSELNQTQKAAVAQTVAGKYQLSRFEALMNRSDLYNQYKEGSETAEDTMDEMNAEYLDSLPGRLNKIQATIEGIINDLMNSDDLYPFIDGAQTILDIVNNIVKSLSGIGPIVSSVAAVVLNLVRNQAATAMMQSIMKIKDNASEIIGTFIGQDTNEQNVKQLLNQTFGKNEAAKYSAPGNTDNIVYTQADYMIKNQGSMTDEQRVQANADLKNAQQLANAFADAKNQVKEAEKAAESADTEFVKANRSFVEAEMAATKQGEAVDKAAIKVKEAEQKLNEAKAYKGSFEEGLDNLHNADRLPQLQEELEGAEKDYANAVSEYEAAVDLLKEADSDVNKAEIQEEADAWEALAREANDRRNAAQQEIDNISKSTADSRIKSAEDELKAAEKDSTAAQKKAEAAEKDKQTAQKKLENAENGRKSASQEIENSKNRVAAAQADVEAEQKRQKAQQVEQNIKNIMNKGLALADTAAAVSSISNLVAALGNLTNGTGDFSSVLANLIPTAVSAVSAMNSLNTAFDGTKISIAGLSVGLGPVIGGIAALVSIIIGVIQSLQQASEVAQQKENEAIASATKKASQLNTSMSSWNSLYEEYKKTGEASDELKSAAESMAEQIGDAGAKAQATAGNYDALAISIRNAADEANKDVIDEVTNSIGNGGKNAESRAGIGFWNGSAQNDLMNSQRKAAFSLGNAGLTQDLSGFNADNFDNDAQRIGAVKDEIASLQAQLDSYGDSAEAAGIAEDEWNQKTGALRAAITNLQDGLSIEDINTYADDLQKAADAAANLSSTQDAISNAGKDFEALKNAFTNDSNISTYFDSLGQSISGQIKQIDFMINHVTNDAQKMALEAQKSILSVQQMFQSQGLSEEQASEAGDLLRNSGLTDEQIVTFVGRLDEDTTLDDFKNKLSRIIEVLNNGNLSNEDKLKLLGELDVDQIVQNANEIIAGLNSGNSIDDIIAKIKVEVDTDELEEGYQDVFDGEKLLKQADIDTDKFDAYYGTLKDGNKIVQDSESVYNDAIRTKQDFINTTQDEIDRLKEEQQSVSGDEWDDYQHRIEDAEEAQEDATSSLSDLNDELDDFKKRAVVAQKGVDDLADNWDDWVKAVQNTDGTTSLENQISAINDMSNAVGNMLGIDMSGWSQGAKQNFLDAAIASGDLQAAIEGDVDALYRLQALAAQQILIQAGIDDTNLWAQINDINNYITNYDGEMVAGSYLDNTDFIAKLDEMVQTALADGASIEQILKALAAMGVDAEVTYKESTIKLPNYKTVENGGANRPTGGMDLGGGVNQTLSWIRSGYTTETVQTPEFHYKWNGAAGISNKSSSRSGSRGSTGYTPRSTRGSGGGGGGSKSPKSGSGGGGGGSKSPKSGSGGSGGNGGSGSGSGDTYEPRTMEKEEDELDRYEKVDTRLEDISSKLNKLQSEQDRLTGDQLLKNMEKQIKLLRKQIEYEKQKLEIQKAEAEEIKNQLAASYGVSFDEEGFISNYAERHDALLADVNNLIDQYNAATTEEAQDALSDSIDAAKDKLSDFNEFVQRYDELWGSDIQDTLNTIEDAEDSIEDIMIEAFNKSTEVLDNLKDINDTWAKFKHNLHRGIDENPFDELADSAERLSEYFDLDEVDTYFDGVMSNYEKLRDATSDPNEKAKIQNQIDEYRASQVAAHMPDGSIDASGTGYLDMAMANMKAITEQIDQYESSNGEYSSIFGKNGEELYQSAKDIYEQATGALEDLWDQMDDLHDKILDCIDDIIDRMNDQNEKFDDINDQLDHIMNVSEYIYGDQAYEQQNKVLAAQYENYKSQLDYLNQEKSVVQEMMDGLEQSGRKFTDDGKHYTEEYQKLIEQLRDVTSDINSTIEDSLETLQKQYQNTVKKIIDVDWIQNTFGEGMDMDWLSTEWELLNRNADQYLDDVNKSYNIQKLQNDYLDLLDDYSGNNLGIQQKITNQMNEQLGYLRNKTKLSQYDVQYAQAQLEILQKQIALEEAQQNKSQMRLRRDTQGNYRYVYSANNDNVREAESDLLDAQNNAYNLSKDQMTQVQDDALSAMKDAQSLLNDIWSNTNLTVEERAKRTEEIIASLKEYLNGAAEQLSTSEQNIINDFIDMCELLTDENKEGLEDVYNEIINGNNDAFDKIDTRWDDSISYWLQHLDNFYDQTNSMYNDLVATTQNYEYQVNELADVAGSDFRDIDNSIQQCVDSTRELSAETSNFIAQLRADAGVVQNYENTLSDYNAKLMDSSNAMRAYANEVQGLKDKVTAKELENIDLSNKLDAALNNNNSSSSSDTNSSGNSNSGSGSGVDEATAFGIAQNIWTYGSWDNDPVRKQRIISRYGEATAKRAQEIVNEYVYGKKAQQLVNYDSKKYGYDTGGYTGDWSDKTGAYKNGKLAFLHQKEIVLNQQDTSNILDAVNVVRGMVNNLKSGLVQETVYNMANAVQGTHSAVSGDNSIQQEVHITAEFPNANTASEIENALLSLNDRSIQYAFKSRYN